ncbi:hypothetical protein EDC01DRAFT_632961 [Geopyxis carbonaria]|nr:hypothetical protein EDC01DRAFT_632961 [Geopyxis carbonaria]
MPSTSAGLAAIPTFSTTSHRSTAPPLHRSKIPPPSWPSAQPTPPHHHGLLLSLHPPDHDVFPVAIANPDLPPAPAALSRSPDDPGPSSFFPPDRSSFCPPDPAYHPPCHTPPMPHELQDREGQEGQEGHPGHDQGGTQEPREAATAGPGAAVRERYRDPAAAARGRRDPAATRAVGVAAVVAVAGGSDHGHAARAGGRHGAAGGAGEAEEGVGAGEYT